ncbi:MULTISPECIES: DUF2069 domain-containing protein [Ramlibacter]|uniref:DUF2069 domain-containing protein n=1 Tax=Ramlibacter pinisoli TaxID=2682844 RepID=A0A6N8IQB5_9BURK|nr:MULTISPECIES: DUF2069 domain-containing protein [Ramlibacter]MBA2963936.1 DUF2069 domain-containing protein [Ramlibacter sp. CGMCC 1.13660]MVQ28902.1 DUF2069 domain-containing protein [Ramlibacter pinisoli]
MHDTSPAATAASPELRAIRALAVGSLVALIAFDVAWDLAVTDLRPSGLWTALKVLPLCIALSGLLRHRMYTYRWMSLLVWLYFVEGVVRAWSERGAARGLAGLEILLCLLLFAACGLHVRQRLGWGRKKR